ncbi:MAG: putative selenate ABC transporter substrate-binding protein [Planctomycetes bacterium]|nr:putative selenate ABC transporter substrate-binding protein [Planctomycetota bacterium]
MLNRLFIAAFTLVTAFTVAACGDKPAAPAGDGGHGAAPKAPDAPKAPEAPKDDRASWPKVLNVSAIPDIKNRDEFLTTYAPFVERLKTKLGIDVKFDPVTEYTATVDKLASGGLDLVWYGGYTSVQAARASKGNMERLVCRAEDLKFKSVFVAAPGSGIKTLADLKGKTFSFGSESSTSGHLMPRSFLLAAGMDPKTALGKVSFSGGHDATVKAVEAGTVEAGALNYLVWDKMTAEKKYDPAKVAVFWTTPEYVDYCWCTRKDLPAGLRKAMKDLFLGLDAKNPEDAALLAKQKATKYVECNDAMWKGIEDAAKSAGMLKD